MKAEFYSCKSYIREAIAGGRWRVIIGDTTAQHKRICQLLLPHVLQGKSRADLGMVRAEIYEQLSTCPSTYLQQVPCVALACGAAGRLSKACLRGRAEGLRGERSADEGV